MNRCLLAVSVLAFTLVACAGGGQSGPSAAQRADLKAAIDRMHALRSFRMETTTTGSDDNGRVVADFQAPDLVHSTTEGAIERSESFRSADTLYFADSMRPGYFFASPLKGAGAKQRGPLFLLDLFLKTPLHVHGAVYSARLPSGGTSGADSASEEVTIGNGYVTKTVFRYRVDGESIAATTTYSLFDAAPPVVLPPADRVMPAPTTPTCDAGGLPPAGQVVCTGGAHNDIGSPVSVPRPASPAPSTLQLRPVLDTTAAACPSGSENPPADAEASVPDLGGRRCFRLGPAGLTITKAKTDAVRGINGTVNVQLQLSSSDSRRFDDVGAANYQRQVAVVMFGQVLSAPQINATQFNGRAEISGLTPEQAGKVIAALSG